MSSAEKYCGELGVATACRAFGVPRASLYRRRKRHAVPPPPVHKPRKSPPRALSSSQRQKVLQVLCEDRFVDLAPRQVFAALLDERKYYCSVRTMYRILSAKEQVRERRNQRRHPKYTKPELLATRPNEVWSWDITKLKGPAKWTYYDLYVILDIFSRYVVGWMVAEREASALAQKLIQDSCTKQDIRPNQLTLHADRGSSMRSKPVALLLSDLGVTKTHSRPHVSNDNPFSEAQFKTLKYRPDFPERFGSPQHARSHAKDFFDWHNNDHYHTGLNLLTPADVHYGQDKQVVEQRQRVLNIAYAQHPERFVNNPPVAKSRPEAVWINPPKDTNNGA